MDRRDLKYLLKIWGKWKREYVLGIGGGVSTEYKIMAKLPFGTGCTNGGLDYEHINGVKILRNEVAEFINTQMLALQQTHPVEVTILTHIYSFEWSDRKLAKAMRGSRTQLVDRKIKAENMIEARLAGSSVDPSNRQSGV